MINMNKIADEAIENYDIVITGQYGPHACLKEAKEYLLEPTRSLIALLLPERIVKGNPATC